MGGLLPCPFCGGEAKLSSWDDDWNSCRRTDTYWQVGCDTDGCLGESSRDQYLASEEAAVNAWNTRPAIDRLQKERDELAEALEVALEIGSPSAPEEWIAIEAAEALLARVKGE